MVEPEGLRAEHCPGRVANSGIRQSQAAFDGSEQENIRQIVKHLQEDAWRLSSVSQIGDLMTDRHKQPVSKPLDSICSQNPGLHGSGQAFPYARPIEYNARSGFAAVALLGFGCFSKVQRTG